MSRGSFGHSVLSRFNGAAARMRRRAGTYLTTGILIQDASTGPPHGCGGGSYPSRSRSISFTLQRGRRTDAAEGFSPAFDVDTKTQASTGPPHGCGGGGDAGARLRRELVASTGPPHGCGGGPGSAGQKARLPTASTGPPHGCGGARPRGTVEILETCDTVCERDAVAWQNRRPQSCVATASQRDPFALSRT